MPIYEYVCKECGHELEALQKIKDDPLKQCPECDKEALKKKISAAAFHLKGTGWYETDFKGKKKDNTADSTKSSDSASDSGGGSDDKKSSSDSDTSTKSDSKKPDSKPQAA